MYTYTRQDVAELLWISTRSVDRYIKDWKLRSKKEWKIVYVNNEDVKNLWWTWEVKHEIIDKKEYEESKKEKQQQEEKNIEVVEKKELPKSKEIEVKTNFKTYPLDEAKRWGNSRFVNKTMKGWRNSKKLCFYDRFQKISNAFRRFKNSSWFSYKWLKDKKWRFRKKIEIWKNYKLDTYYNSYSIAYYCLSCLVYEYLKKNWKNLGNLYNVQDFLFS